MSTIQFKRALISVSDKSGLVELAAALAKRGVEILSTGGTRRALEGADIPVRDVAQYTGFPEMMDGRLKTLHPKIFGGILARRNRDDDLASLAEHDIELIDLVVVNLYPFEQTVARADVTDAEAIEQIDIGGPSLVRAAAKNHAFTAIVTAPGQYGEVLEQLQAEGGTTLSLRRQLARQAFEHTAAYDRAIADYFSREGAPAEDSAATADDSPFPARLNVELQRRQTLRYGENPHQPAAVYAAASSSAPNVARNLITARQLHGKELSYNNLLDLDSALAIVRGLERPAAAVIKHNNPCGAAAADELADAAERALAGDPQSAFGSILSFNRVVDAATAERLAAPGLFIEAIVAPDFEPAALEILTTRPKWKNNVRLLAVGDVSAAEPTLQLRQIEGGMLAQLSDTEPANRGDWKCATEAEPTAAQRAELEFAWEIVRHVKSNAIVLCRDLALAGAGAGQMSRVDSVEIAISKAGERAAGSVLASDAFFPFADSIHRAAEAGVAAIIQPGGSRRDEEVIAACNERGLPMILTGRRHFKH